MASGDCYQTFKEELTLIFLKIPKYQGIETLPNSFYKISITLIAKPDKDNERKDQ